MELYLLRKLQRARKLEQFMRPKGSFQKKKSRAESENGTFSLYTPPPPYKVKNYKVNFRMKC